MKNKKKIRITFVQEGLRKEFFETCLRLRVARNVGDVETINHYVFSCLQRFEDYIKFEVIL